jgi:hypothetical protein
MSPCFQAKEAGRFLAQFVGALLSFETTRMCDSVDLGCYPRSQVLQLLLERSDLRKDLLFASV